MYDDRSCCQLSQSPEVEAPKTSSQRHNVAPRHGRSAPRGKRGKASALAGRRGGGMISAQACPQSSTCAASDSGEYMRSTLLARSRSIDEA